jgi:ketosteroid isomerase-like protein
MKYCTPCDLEYPDTSRFCKSCGKQVVEKPSGSLEPSVCPSCGAAVQSRWRFCKQCAHVLDETTIVRPRASPLPQAQGVGSPAATVIAPPPTPLPPVTVAVPPKQEECRACRHLSKPGSEKCEACGAPVGSYARKLRAKRIATVAAVLLAVIVLATGVAAAGWYAMGVKVAIQTDPGDSKVVIDGQEVGRTNAYGSLTSSRIRAGDHSLAVMRDGYDEWKQTFNIAFTDLSKSLNVKLNLTKYKLTVVSSPAGSEVLVDNNSMGSTNEQNGNLETAPFAPGDHTVVVRHDGYRDWKQTIKLNGDQKLEVTLTSAPVFDENSASADSEVKNALEGWAQATRNRDVDSHMRYYADTLDYYYNRTLVPSSKVRDDRNNAFQKFNYLSVQLTNINVQLDSTGQRATVVLDKTFDFRGDNDASFSGSVQDQLTLTKLGGAWLITGEKELKVYYVNK